MLLMLEGSCPENQGREVYLLRLDSTESRLFLLLPEDDEWATILILGVDGVHSFHGVAVVLLCSGKGGMKERAD